MAPRILSVSYDESLLVTRQMMLERAGFTVTSALGFEEALEHCDSGNFDLLLVGHSIPQRDKRSLIKAARRTCKAPVLSIRRHGDVPLSDADDSVDAVDGPKGLMEAIQNLLNKTTSGAAP
jgi:DNA-binding response OmpR family regulator